MNRNHKFGAQCAHGRSGDLLGKKAVHQEMILMLDREKQSGVSARGAKRGTNFAARKVYRLAFDQVCSDNTEWNLHLAEIIRGSEAVKEIVERCVGGHPHARKSQTAEMAEASGAAVRGHHFQCR